MHSLARHGLRAIQVVREGSCDDQSPATATTLGVTHHPLFDGVGRV